MFPIRDLNPTRTRPVMTWALIAACLAVFVYEMLVPAGDRPAFVAQWAFVPARLTAGEPHAFVTIFTAMFLHAGLLHVAGNLWFLRLFGDNVEDAIGRTRYLLLYVVCGIAAAGAQYLAAPGSHVPMLGASGAIGGVLGAYAALYPRARVQALMVGFWFGVVEVPAVVYLGLWLALQIVAGLGSAAHDGGVAYWAHIGGFGTGLVVGLIFRGVHRGAPQDRSLGWGDEPRAHTSTAHWLHS